MAVDMFLKLDGVAGESKDKVHSKEIDVLSLAHQKVSLRDRPVFFVELNKHGRLATLLKFDPYDANIRENKCQWR